MSEGEETQGIGFGRHLDRSWDILDFKRDRMVYSFAGLGIFPRSHLGNVFVPACGTGRSTAADFVVGNRFVVGEREASGRRAVGVDCPAGFYSGDCCSGYFDGVIFPVVVNHCRDSADQKYIVSQFERINLYSLKGKSEV